MAVQDWAGQDWGLALGGVAVLLTGIGSFITSMVTLRRVKDVDKKVDGMLVERDASNVSAGERKGKHAAELIAEALAEGQRQGREQAREEAKVPSLHVSGVPGPVPVADDRVAVATENMADDTRRMADAAEAAVPAAKGK